MSAVFKREFKSYFNNPVGYVCVAALAALYGFFFYQVMLMGSSSYVGNIYYTIFTYGMMIVPILTMRTFSEDRKNKTDQALLTAPVNVSGIVMGKFFSAFAIYAIATLMGVLPALALSAFATLPWGIIIGNVIGTLLYGGAMISIGVFISSLTVSQVIAALVTFAIYLMLLFQILKLFHFLLSYKQTEKFFAGKNKEKLVVTGNPVRPAFYSASAKKGRDFLGLEEVTDKPVLVVIGGSLGAKQINELIYQNIEFLCEHFIVVHQTGAGNEVPITEKVANDSYKPYSFIYGEMPDVLAAADIILSRAGANSLWECAVLKKPMVLVPLCGSGTRGDQVENARFFEENNAATVLLGEDADSQHLQDALIKMLDESTRKNFAESCSALKDSIPPAKRIADLLYTEVVSK